MRDADHPTEGLAGQAASSGTPTPTPDLAWCPRCQGAMQESDLGRFYCQNCGVWFAGCHDCGELVEDERYAHCGACGGRRGR